MLEVAAAIRILVEQDATFLPALADSTSHERGSVTLSIGARMRFVAEARPATILGGWGEKEKFRPTVEHENGVPG